MEPDMRLNALKFLDYKEMKELKTEGSPYKTMIIEGIKSSLLQQLTEKIPNEPNVDLAFRIQIQLQDDMNLVGKIEEIPINHIILNVPVSASSEPMYQSQNKLKFRDRIRILFKGKI